MTAGGFLYKKGRDNHLWTKHALKLIVGPDNHTVLDVVITLNQG